MRILALLRLEEHYRRISGVIDCYGALVLVHSTADLAQELLSVLYLDRVFFSVDIVAPADDLSRVARIHRWDIHGYAATVL